MVMKAMVAVVVVAVVLVIAVTAAVVVAVRVAVATMTAMATIAPAEIVVKSVLEVHLRQDRQQKMEVAPVKSFIIKRPRR